MAAKRKKRGRGRPPKGSTPPPAEMREQLVRAAIQLVTEQGISAVTSTALAHKVDISQSGFYQHFANVNECLGVAAVTFGQEMRLELRSTRDRFFAHITGADDASIEEKLKRGFEHSIAYIMDQPRNIQMLKLFRRFLGDTSPFGLALKRVNEQMVDDVVSEIYAANRQRAFTPKHLPAIRVYAQFSLSLWESAVQMLIADPALDRPMVVNMLTRSQHAIIGATRLRTQRKRRAS